MTSTAEKFITEHGAATGAGNFSVAEWCARRRISRATLYNLLKRGEGPRLHKIGSRTFISAEADRDWVAEREADYAREHAADHGQA